jgi:hypothetical protein
MLTFLQIFIKPVYHDVSSDYKLIILQLIYLFALF